MRRESTGADPDGPRAALDPPPARRVESRGGSRALEMRMRVGFGVAIRSLLFAVLAFAPSATRGEEPGSGDGAADADPLAVAAEDTWPMQDGCPAHTRATRTRALLGPLVDAWTFKSGG